MRIHTNKVDGIHILQAAHALPSVIVRKYTEHGSRTHKHAYEVNLEGYGKRHTRWANDGKYGRADWKAATRDDWGWFLSALYDIDRDMRAGGSRDNPVYEDRGDFHVKTHNRYNPDSLDRTDYPTGGTK